jgi:hypothetical protein
MNWRSFIAGLALGAIATWLVLATFGLWSIHVSASQVVRFNKITGRTESYYQGWHEMK